MNYFMKILNSKISLFIIGYATSLGKKDYLIGRIEILIQKRKNNNKILKYNAFDFNSYPQ